MCTHDKSAQAYHHFQNIFSLGSCWKHACEVMVCAQHKINSWPMYPQSVCFGSDHQKCSDWGSAEVLRPMTYREQGTVCGQMG